MSIQPSAPWHRSCWLDRGTWEAPLVEPSDRGSGCHDLLDVVLAAVVLGEGAGGDATLAEACDHDRRMRNTRDWMVGLVVRHVLDSAVNR
jgi:hypothetical protein